jgi:hypothetical protein
MQKARIHILTYVIIFVYFVVMLIFSYLACIVKKLKFLYFCDLLFIITLIHHYNIMDQYLQRFKNLFAQTFHQDPVSFSSFKGCYYTIDRGSIRPEKGFLSVKETSNPENEKELCWNVKKLSPVEKKESTIITIGDEHTWLRKDGVLVREVIQKGLFGEDIKIADTQLMVDGNILRKVYHGYWFKGPLGGYWGSSQKTIGTFTRCHPVMCVDL